MPYNRIERYVATLLDSTPDLRRLVKASYQRANYLIHGRHGQSMRLHPQATIERPRAVRCTTEVPDDSCECFFGYFGLSPWSHDGRYYLFHEWHRHRRSVAVCLYDRFAGESEVLAESIAWNFQQGSMAQWLADDSGLQSIAFNDCVDRKLVCRIVTLGGQERRLDWPVQSIHPRGTHALSLNYRRLARIQPEYGYDAEVDNFKPDQSLQLDGIWRMDLGSGDAQLIVSLEALAKLAPRPDMLDADHKVNHAMYSPSGEKFVFMHRWRGSLGRFSRLYCARSDGADLRLLLDHRMVSHYAWRDEKTVLVWARAPDHGDRYYLIDLSTGAREVCGAGTLDQFGDGHPSFSPDRKWILTDTYPDRARIRRLLMCRPSTKTMIEVGAFHSPWRYDGPRRCDLHPRWDPGGKLVSIDSTHEGVRRTYMIDVSRILADA